MHPSPSSMIWKLPAQQEYLEELQLLLVGEALDVGGLHICLKAELLPPEQGEGAVKGLLHVRDLPLQLLLPILQLAVLH